MLFEQLKRPFGYLFIKEVKGKALYDWLYPIILTICTWILFYLSGKDHAFLSEHVIAGLVSFVGNLPGFFIAALAAIATFQSPKLEEYVETSSSITPCIKYDIVDENKKIVNKSFPLKRRAFLSYMFAFLTALSFIIVIISKLALMIPECSYLNIIYCWTLILIFYQMTVTTFCGLYYLGSRLHE